MHHQQHHPAEMLYYTVTEQTSRESTGWDYLHALLPLRLFVLSFGCTYRFDPPVCLCSDVNGGSLFGLPGISN